ncbi:LOW QUALITY PROTEIN: cilia- and flagella-associated protein 221-like [Xenentodon cancila]
MEVAPSGPQILSPRRGTPLPLNQLVEERSSRGSIPNHLLQSKIYAKVKRNSQIEVEPSELHFGGFELGKNYTKMLKLINISSEVMNIHIIPTQTKYFQTTYTKKDRLIPGLAYTLKVRFCPDEWRYFYDCIRVHCEGEENLLIPLHAYPVIDDLHIPPRIDLSAVPLGQRVFHTIPLRCSSPIDFEFQVNVIEPHEAFSIHPVTGVIPASSEAKITVIFSPHQYETCQVTFQLVVSQFNTKPYLCTVTGSSAPFLTLSQLEKKPDHRGSPPGFQAPPRSKTRSRLSKEAGKVKTLRREGDAPLGPAHSVDVCTPAGVAKMLIKDINKLTSKDLKQAVCSGSVAGLQSRQMKEALFIKKVNQAEREEQAKRLSWQVHLGMEPMSEQTRREIVEERAIHLHQCMVKRGDVRQDEDFAAGQTKLSSGRVRRDAGQIPEGSPCFQFHISKQWEVAQWALRLFRQAACKVAIRCRMNRRLASLKKLAETWRNQSSVLEAEDQETCDLQISPDKLFPSSFPIFSNEEDLLAPSNLVAVAVDPIDVAVTTHIPFFKLQVPQHYKLMGYQPVSAWDAFNSSIPASLARPLRFEAPVTKLHQKHSHNRSIVTSYIYNLTLHSSTCLFFFTFEDGTAETRGQFPKRAPVKSGEEEDKEEHASAKEAADLCFSAPDALLRPFPAHPLRIFNPAPGLQTYKPQPKYLESDLEYHLCPVARYSLPGSNSSGSETQTSRTRKKFLKDAFAGVMKWDDFDSVFFTRLSDQPALTRDLAPRRSINYNIDILPLTAPLPLAALPDDLLPLMESPCEGSGLQLTPDMIRAEFLSGNAPVSHSNLAAGQTVRSEISRMGARVMTRLKQLRATDRNTHPPAED